MKAKLSVLAISLVALSGCAAIQRQQATDSETFLAQAGFQRAPLEADDLKRLPLQLLADGESYVFADPKFCNCRYVGGQKELESLQQLRTARRLDHERAVRAIGVTSGNSDQRAWGGWDPKGLDVRFQP